MRELIQTVLGFVAVLFPFLILLLRRRSASTAGREAEQQRGPLTGRPDSDLFEQADVRNRVTDADDPMQWLRRVAHQREEVSLQQSGRLGFSESEGGHASSAEPLQRGLLERRHLESRLATSIEQERETRPPTRRSAWQRILRLPPLQRAILLADVIGPPKGYGIDAGTQNNI